MDGWASFLVRDLDLAKKKKNVYLSQLTLMLLGSEPQSL